MRILTSLSLACLFVFLAGFNVWNMLSGRGTSARSSKLWTQVHRIAGYAFIALFAIFFYFMLLRIRGWSDELSPRLILHMGLALLLVPLLFTKVIVARYQRAARGLLIALGIGIFSVAFTLVTLNLFVHYLRVASTKKLPGWTSTIAVTVALIAAVIAFLGRGEQPKAKSGLGILRLDNPAEPKPSKRDEALNLTLARIQPQTRDAKTLRFLLPRGCQIAARPGQFLTFEWIVGGKPVIRSYSICSSPAQAGYVEITPKRVENGCVSQFLNDRAELGLRVKARGPYGKFYFDEEKHQRIVLIAGGSGITPMIAMLRYIDDLCISADVTLIHCARNEQDVLFKQELEGLEGRLNKYRCAFVLSRPSPDWTGWKGRLRREILEREVEDPLGSTFFLCGPPAFMELSRARLTGMAVDPARILQESFGGAVAAEPQPDARAGVFEVKFARSTTSFKVSPEQTLLQSAELNGVLMRSGCRQGNCGTCATKLLCGDVRMEGEEALSDEMRAEGIILPCVSRPLSDLTLDA